MGGARRPRPELPGAVGRAAPDRPGRRAPRAALELRRRLRRRRDAARVRRRVRPVGAWTVRRRPGGRRGHDRRRRCDDRDAARVARLRGMGRGTGQQPPRRCRPLLPDVRLCGREVRRRRRDRVPLPRRAAGRARPRPRGLAAARPFPLARAGAGPGSCVRNPRPRRVGSALRGHGRVRHAGAVAAGGARSSPRQRPRDVRPARRCGPAGTRTTVLPVGHRPGRPDRLARGGHRRGAPPGGFLQRGDQRPCARPGRCADRPCGLLLGPPSPSPLAFRADARPVDAASHRARGVRSAPAPRARSAAWSHGSQE